MLFSSMFFIFVFLPLTLLLYHALPSIRWKDSVLILASLIFYAWGEFQYTGVMIISILFAWGFGRLIHLAKTQKNKKIALNSGIFSILGLLLYFKYANFFCENLLSIISPIKAETFCKAHLVHLPIGVSFFTFQSISYLIDIYRGHAKAQKSLLKIGLYKVFFAQLIAGPIVRYVDVAKDIEERKSLSDDMSIGAERFILGLAKKVLIANTVGKSADAIFGLGHEQLGFTTAWFGAVCYFFQIYYDFSGYSDMAIGLGRMFGFHYRENFDFPYSATSITDFWRRWHISLSSWFRDYLYIPLGGNRVSNARTYLNLYIVFALCGFWHGASWNFVLWGLFHGTFLVLERVGLGKKLERLPQFLSTSYVWGVVIVGWVFFRTETVRGARIFLKSLFFLNEPRPFARPISSFLTPELSIILLAAFLFSFNLPSIAAGLQNTLSLKKLRLQSAYAFLILGLFGISLIYLAGATFNPFIYFRF